MKSSGIEPRSTKSTSMKSTSTTSTGIETTKENAMQDNTTETAAVQADDIEDGITVSETDVSKPDTQEKAIKPPSPRSKSAKGKKAEVEATAVKVPDPDVRILKVTHCPSLSGRSELTYHIGCIGNAIQLRVYGNSGKGCFNQEWVPYSAIADLVASHEEVSAGTLRSIFVGKSVNTAGFFMAVLKDLGLIETSKANRRCYTHSDATAFEAEAAKLIASGVAVEVAERDTSPVGKRGKPKQA